MKAIKLTKSVQQINNVNNIKDLNDESKIIWRDKLIALTIISLIFVQIYWFTIPKIIENWWDGTLKYIGTSLNIISAFAPLILAFTLKNKIYRNMGIIFSIISILIAIYSNIEWLQR